MDGWNKWIGKKVFLRTKKDRMYSGTVTEVIEIDESIAFFSLVDRFDMWVTVATSEIAEIKEER